MGSIKAEELKEKKWHSLSSEEVVKALQTSTEEGLTQEEVKKRLETFGKNILPEGKKRSTLVRFLIQFHNILIYLLLAAAVITALMDHWIDTFVILAVVIINALIGFIQEGKAEKAIEGIKKMLSLEATVIRENHRKKIDAEELVPGDLVILSSGDKIPADIRILSAKNFRVEESPLTGESTDVNKKPDEVDEGAGLGDRHNMAFSGTMVTSGEATGVIVATGENTEIGKISQMISEVEEITTPLLQKIHRFGKWLSIFIVTFGLLVFSFGYLFRDFTIVELVMAVIGLVVASIPEGLPAIMTITLAIGVQKMAQRHAIIRRLPSVETLGAVSVICSDKTGTLTRNEMTAKTIITAEELYEVEGSGYKPEGKVSKDDKDVDLPKEPVLEKLTKAIKACNNAEISQEKGGEWKLVGTPTEGALITLSYKLGMEEFNPKRLDVIPFDSEHKFMATLNETKEDRYIYVKGAPEKLLEMCKKQLTLDGEKEIDKSYWKGKFESLAEKGERLIGVAYKEAGKDQTTLDVKDIQDDLIMLGFVGIIDPPREEVKRAIEECKEAGIRVIMITGDHAITAKVIAAELGIDVENGVITGSELEEMDDEELKKIAKDHDVFARTSPEHKLRLVKALQANNLLCAMTGDGVNDAPALKRANIGIAMGIKGTEVAKDASGMILTDDNFASIVNAVEEGRTVYDNIRKTILFLLPANGAEATVLIAAIIFGLTLPITPVQILWVNMVSAVTLALALSFEPMEQKVMKLPPRDPDRSIIGGFFIWRVMFVSLLSGGLTFLLFMRNYQNGTYDIETARTIAVNMLVACHFFYLFTCRKLYESTFSKSFFDNKIVFVSVGALIILQLLFTYLPFMNNLFGTTGLILRYWRYPLIAGLMVLLLVEVEKLIVRKIKR
ncbi:MAG: cation-transporting P-type ATPase [Candidatus Cloacimonetes bacterium]|nr:cation-transporting P-type ATPase [Candidatus Cloacimonadota bacterium]